MSIDRRAVIVSLAAIPIPVVGNVAAPAGSDPALLLARLDHFGAAFSAIASHPGWYEVRLPASAIGTPMRFGVCVDPAVNCDPGLARLVEDRLRATTNKPLV